MRSSAQWSLKTYRGKIWGGGVSEVQEGGGICMYSLIDIVVWQKPTVHFKHLSSYYGEGNGTPLQYSCLENAMDRGAW